MRISDAVIVCFFATTPLASYAQSVGASPPTVHVVGPGPGSAALVPSLPATEPRVIVPPSAPPPERAEEPAPKADKKVVVLDLRATDATASVSRALTVVLASEVGATDGYDAVSRNDLRSLLAHQTDVQMLGCDDVKCMSKIAQMVAADLLVAGSVEQVEGVHVLSLELIDPGAGRVVERQTASWRGDDGRMVELVRPYVDRLLHGTRAQSFVGMLEVLAPEGAEIVVDGQPVGTAPLGHKVGPLSSGVHSLVISQPGFVTLHDDVIVLRGETTLYRAEMIDVDADKPWYARWWVWGSVGGGLAIVGGTAAAIAVLATLTQTPTTLAVEQ